MTAHTPHTPIWRSALSLPKTRLGWWSLGLAAVGVVLPIFGYTIIEVMAVEDPWEGVLMPFYGIAPLLCGLCGGVTALIALLRRHERSALVWLALLPGLAALTFLIGEFLGKW